MTLKMPRKTADDGPVWMNRVNYADKAKRIVVTVTQNNETSSVTMSEHNAWRVFALLALTLQIPLPKEVAEKIEL